MTTTMTTTTMMYDLYNHYYTASAFTASHRHFFRFNLTVLARFLCDCVCECDCV